MTNNRHCDIDFQYIETYSERVFRTKEHQPVVYEVNYAVIINLRIAFKARLFIVNGIKVIFLFLRQNTIPNFILIECTLNVSTNWLDT